MNTDQHTIKTRRYTIKHAPSVNVALLLAPLIAFAEEKAALPSNGLVPEVPGLNLKDKLYQLEAKLPDLEQPYIIGYRGKLIFESYYRRGRANFPHYQMSITKSYTALAIGRAIQLGLLKMEDLDKPAISFLKELDTTKLVAGADTITLAQAMQVLNAVAPGGAEEFIKTELLGRMGIAQYHWEHAISGLPKSAAGSRTYHAIEGRGAGGQFIFIFPELDLITVITSHNKGMGDMLQTLPQRFIPAFVP